MIIDLDCFKEYNDTYGHVKGDEVLIAVSDLISSAIKDIGSGYRFGGDEFLIIAPECDDSVARKVKHDILKYMEKKNHDGTRPYKISASCGYVITDPDSGYPLQEYIREADRLMYEIKREVHALDEVERAKEAQEIARNELSNK